MVDVDGTQSTLGLVLGLLMYCVIVGIAGLVYYLVTKKKPISNYWIQKFSKLSNQSERPKTSWNWAAWFFNNIWLACKGMWAYSLIMIAVIGFSFSSYSNTGSIGFPSTWMHEYWGPVTPVEHHYIFSVIPCMTAIFVGVYGNYMYYFYKKTKNQIHPNIIAKYFAMVFMIYFVHYYLLAHSTYVWSNMPLDAQTAQRYYDRSVLASGRELISYILLCASVLCLIASSIRFRTWDGVSSEGTE